MDSIVTAECMNGMAKPAKIMDIDSEKAALGRDLVERACRVDKCDEMEHEGTQLQEIKFYCEENHHAVETQMKTYLLQMDCHSRGSGQYI